MSGIVLLSWHSDCDLSTYSTSLRSRIELWWKECVQKGRLIVIVEHKIATRPHIFRQWALYLMRLQQVTIRYSSILRFSVAPRSATFSAQQQYYYSLTSIFLWSIGLLFFLHHIGLVRSTIVDIKLPFIFSITNT